MKKTTEKNVADALNSIIPHGAKSVLILSRLWTFANTLQTRKKNFAYWLFDLIEEVVGSNRTLIYPAFTFSFGKTKKFDLLKSMPETGALPAIAMLKSTYSRTVAPMNSYFVRGPKKEEVLRLPQKTTFGSDSVPGWIKNNNTLVCALGFPEQNMGWLMVHFAEETIKVPYRYFKILKGRYFIGGKPDRPCSETHFAKPSSVKLFQDNTPLNRELNKRNFINLSPNPYLPFKSAYAEDIVHTSLDILNDNSLKLIVNNEDAVRWIKYHKNLELGNVLK